MAKNITLKNSNQEDLYPITTTDNVVQGGSTLTDVLNNKFDKTGGTITGDVGINGSLNGSVVRFGDAELDGTNQGGSIELGSLSETSTPFIDFHTDGNPNTDYNVRLLASGSELQITAADGISINGYKLGQYGQKIATLQNTNTQTLSNPLSKYSYVLIMSEQDGIRRYSALLPVGYLRANQNNEIRFKCWDDSAFRLIFTSTTVRCTNEYYAYPITIHGMI